MMCVLGEGYAQCRVVECYIELVSFILVRPY